MYPWLLNFNDFSCALAFCPTSFQIAPLIYLFIQLFAYATNIHRRLNIYIN